MPPRPSGELPAAGEERAHAGGGDHGAGEDPMWFADGPRAGDAPEREEGGAQGSGTIDPGTMSSLYYGINPPRHAEKAYQASDGAPPLHPRPTTVGRSGTIVALATTIYNRPPFGRLARFSICDRGGRVLFAGAVATPGRLEVPGLEPGTEVLIRPETIGTMVKLLTPEQIAGGADEAAHPGGAGGAGRNRRGPAPGELADAADDLEEGSGAIDPSTMSALYYGINPPRHAEKAYQASDPAPPLHPRPTRVGRSGTIVALATTIFNRPPFGRPARFSICDRGGGVLFSGVVRTPGKVEVSGLEPGTDVLVRPETIGTMVKLLTPEQIAGAAAADVASGQG